MAHKPINIFITALFMHDGLSNVQLQITDRLTSSLEGFVFLVNLFFSSTFSTFEVKLDCLQYRKQNKKIYLHTQTQHIMTQSNRNGGILRQIVDVIGESI